MNHGHGTAQEGVGSPTRTRSGEGTTGNGGTRRRRADLGARRRCLGLLVRGCGASGQPWWSPSTEKRERGVREEPETRAEGTRNRDGEAGACLVLAGD